MPNGKSFRKVSSRGTSTSSAAASSSRRCGCRSGPKAANSRSPVTSSQSAASPLWKDGFQLFAGDQSVCEVKRGFWSRRFELFAVDEKWVLQPAGWFTRNYQLLAADREVGQREVGTVRPTGWFTRQRVADFADEVPLPVQVFAIFLVLVVSQRQQRHSSSSGGV